MGRPPTSNFLGNCPPVSLSLRPWVLECCSQRADAYTYKTIYNLHHVTQEGTRNPSLSAVAWLLHISVDPERTDRRTAYH